MQQTRTCTYAGSLTGTAVEASGVLTLSGSLAKVAGSCLGGSTEPVTGRYQLTDLTTSPAQPRLLF